MRVALAAEEYVGLALSWKSARVESVYNVEHRCGRNGLAGLGGCHTRGFESSECWRRWFTLWYEGV